MPAIAAGDRVKDITPGGRLMTVQELGAGPGRVLCSTFSPDGSKLVQVEFPVCLLERRLPIEEMPDEA